MPADSRPAVVAPEPPAKHDVGLGTAYERWAVYRLLREWAGRLPAESALEGPIDGMAGIPGLHLMPLAERGTRVTVLVPDESAAAVVAGVYERVGLRDRLDVRASRDWPRGELFDLVLTYDALPFVEDWQGYLASAAAVARRSLLVSVTHPWSYGTFARRILRLVQPGERPFELFDHPSTRERVLSRALSRHGEVVLDAFVDCPWWPDLFVPTGQTLLSGTLGRLPFGRRFLRPVGGAPDPAEAFLYGPARFPLLGGEGFADELSGALRRHPTFDRSPRPVAAFFAHHRIRAVALRSAGSAG